MSRRNGGVRQLSEAWTHRSTAAEDSDVWYGTRAFPGRQMEQDCAEFREVVLS